MTVIRDVPLAQRRGDAAALAEDLKVHRRACPLCRRARAHCLEYVDLKAELAAVRREIAHWFDPDSSQGVLF